jgi:hypothetical protein
MTTFHVSPVPAGTLARIRARGADDLGNPVVVRPAQEGDPLRCCLRDARAGEQVALIAYQPSSIGGPYAEIGPIFIHAAGCPGWNGGGYPDGFRHRQQLLRAYDESGAQLDNVIVEPGEAEGGLSRLLDRPEVAFVHSRNLLAGCYMFSVTRTA